MALYGFQGTYPIIGDRTYVHPEATLIGNIVIGKNCFIGPGARLRGDWGRIVIGDDCNIQDNCIIHAKPGKETIVGNRCHIAHGTILHGSTLEDEVFVGMNCVVMDGSILHKRCCLAAGTLVLEGGAVAEETLALGAPMKEARKISPELRQKLAWGLAQYITLPAKYLEEAKDSGAGLSVHYD